MRKKPTNNQLKLASAPAPGSASTLDRLNFEHRALRLIERLDSHCRDMGLQAYLHETETWNPDYASEVAILMGEAFEIMRLKNFAVEKGLMPNDQAQR